MSRRTSIHCSAFANRATITKSYVIAAALLHLILLGPTRADDVKPDECSLASVYSTLTEETASRQDTSVNDRTAAHRSLPFATLVQAENQENGHSAIVRITDRGPFVSGRIIDVSQIAAHELGFFDKGVPQDPVDCHRPRKNDCCDSGNSSASRSLTPSNPWVTRELTWLNGIYEWLVGLLCWQSAVLNVRYDWLLLIGEWALIRRRNN